LTSGFRVHVARGRGINFGGDIVSEFFN